MHRSKSAILAIFQKGTGWSCPDSLAFKNPSQDFKNSFCFGFIGVFGNAGSQNYRDPFFKIQSGKITV